MTLRELGENWAEFWANRKTEIAQLESLPLLDWPLGYLAIAAIAGFLGVALAVGFVVTVLYAGTQRETINKQFEAAREEKKRNKDL